MVFPLNTKENPGVSQVGGKAKSLIKSRLAGFNVPDGFVLSVQFFKEWTDQVKSTGLWQKFLQEKNRETCDALLEFAGRLCFTSEQAAVLKIFAEKMPQNELFAVRSSSPQEDLTLTSFAGQYQTFLGVALPELEKKITDAYSSMFDFRVVEYKQQNNLPVDDPGIAVIVQQQIKSEISGISFSLNPENNAFDEVLINAGFGLGETIVSGQITPDSYIVDKLTNKILSKKITHKDFALHIKNGGGTMEEKNPDPEMQVLSDADILRVTALAAGCEKHYGKPMDIEWALEKGELFLLQARPITTYNPLFPELITKPGEPKKLYLDLILLTQGFSEPLSVLGLDIWGRMMDTTKQGTMPQGEGGYVVNAAGREYSVISNMAKGMGKGVFRMIQSYELPIREVFKSIDLKQEYMPAKKTPEMKQAARDTIKMGLRLAPCLIAGLLNPEKQAICFENFAEETYRYFTIGMLKEGDFSELVNCGNRRFADLCSEYLRVALSGQLSLNKLNKLFKAQGAADLVSLLAAGLPTNPTALMGQKILELASQKELQETASKEEFARKVSEGSYSESFMEIYRAFMQRFGARGIKEVDIATSRISEDPQIFFEQLKAMDIQQNNLVDLKERKKRAYANLLETARSMGKEKTFVMHAQRLELLGYREVPKDLLVVMVAELRKRALDLGRKFSAQGRLDSPEQIFDLSIDQVSEAESNPGLDLYSLRERNLLPRQAAAHVKPRNWPKIVDSRGRIFRYLRVKEDGDLAGEPISPGTVRGYARVLNSPYDKPLKRGEILVTRATEPSWTPIFIHAAGVVLEIGGPLQHGAIIAREYGIPCVSGIDEATNLIHDGDMLEVDGSAGLVKIIR